MKPSDELLGYRTWSLEAVNEAIIEAARKAADLSSGAKRNRILNDLKALYDIKMDLLSIQIEQIINSPAVQEAIRGLKAIVADLEKEAAKLKDATDVVKSLADVLNYGNKALAAIKDLNKK